MYWQIKASARERKSIAERERECSAEKETFFLPMSVELDNPRFCVRKVRLCIFWRER